MFQLWCKGHIIAYDIGSWRYARILQKKLEQNFPHQKFDIKSTGINPV